MGGHGGLNILPQKKWHVWRRDNVERVRRDEERHRAEQAEARERRRRRSWDDRIIRLRRAAAGDGGDVSAVTSAECGGSRLNVNLDSAGGASSASNLERGHSSVSAGGPTATSRPSDVGRGLSGGGNTLGAAGSAAAPGAPGDHVNFFPEAEAAQENLRRAHQRFLEEVQHNEDGAARQPEIERAARETADPWYLRKPEAPMGRDRAAAGGGGGRASTVFEVEERRVRAARARLDALLQRRRAKGLPR